ncbi:MAG: hypothetical protein JRN15_12275 [Nitrososphaerota archaeon]|nr:hypothetical protein [Nitrososphaerota archaeon]
MAIFGIGAMFGRVNDVLEQFIQNEIASMDFGENEAQPLRELIKRIKTGDIIYVKSHPPNLGLIIKAVGIVTSNDVLTDHLPVGTIGVRVRWISRREYAFGQINDFYNVRNNTLYEELNNDVQSMVIELLTERLTPRE